jgi:predicted permease
MRIIDRVREAFRHALRPFLKSPGFALVAVISIAFGTGANVAVFSAVDAFLLRPPPVSDPFALLTVGVRVERGVGTAVRMSYRDYLDVRDRARSFRGLLAYTSRWAGFATTPTAPARIKIATAISANYFDLLGIQPVLGRAFLSDEERVPVRDGVAILGYDLWRQEFAGDPRVIGRTIRVTGTPLTVVGVAPEGFTGLDPYVKDALYVPLPLLGTLMRGNGEDPLEDRSVQVLTVKGRLAAGVTADVARAELAAIAPVLTRAHATADAPQVLFAQPELQARFERRPLESQALVLLTILAITVLCVACANVAGLTASHAPLRAREMAMRLAIGASRGRVIGQLVCESVGLAVVGAAVGLAIGYVNIAQLRTLDFPTEVFAYPPIQLDTRTLMFSLAVAIATVFLFGLGPALQTTRVDLLEAMKNVDTRPSTAWRPHARSALVGAQVAASLVVLTIAAIVIGVFQREFTAGPGFRITQLATERVDVAQGGYSLVDGARFIERVRDDAARLPGVVQVAVVSAMPMRDLGVASMVPEGHRLAPHQPPFLLYTSSVDEHFFDVMNIPLVAGREFQRADGANAPRVAIVNENMARQYWGGLDVVGQRFRLDGEDGPSVEIVGVARNTTYLYSGEPPFDVAYFPFRQAPVGNMTMIAWTSTSASAALEPLRAVVGRIDPNVPVFDAMTIEHFMDVRSRKMGSILVRLVASLGLMGMALAAIGLYGLVAFAVARRTREIGIRLAIGASPRRVLAMVLRQGMMPACVGLGAGLVLSSGTTRALPLIVNVGRLDDAGSLVAVVPLLLLVTLIAAFIPARRASRVDPTQSLRAE